MMQEVSGDSVVTQTNITDQLQEAAQTNVTKALADASGGTAVSATSTIPSVLSPPSQLPPNIGGGFPPISPPAGYPFTTAEEAGSPPPPTAAGAMFPPPPTATGATSPPPPTGGFVRSPGAVSATPSKYPTQFASPPSTPIQQQHQHQSPGSPMSSPYIPPAPPTQPFSPSMPPSQTSISPPSPQSLPPYQASPQSPGQMHYSPPQPNTTYMPEPAQQVPPPQEATASIDLGGAGPVYPQPQEAGANKAGLFGWFSGSTFMNKMVEKTKTLSENVITTLDPGMKEVIYSGGDVYIMVASTKDVKVGAVRQAFQDILGHATVFGQDSQPSSIAPQPVGYTAGLKGCEERIEGLRRASGGADNSVLVAVENFIVEVLPDRWFDIGCVLLKDPVNQIDLQTFTQATPISSEFVQQAQDQTPSTYDLRWSGLQVTVGQVINQRMPYVNPADWHAYFTGVSRREMIYLAAKTLAGMYRQRLANRIQ